MNNGWIKIHRKLLEWEWYDEPNTFRLFFHLLLKANHKPKKYRGVDIKTGQVMTGLNLLAKETGLTVQKVRTSLNNLKSTNEITIKTNNKGTVIQIVKYIEYQVVTSKITNEQQTDNKRITTNNKDNKEKKDNITLDEDCLYDFDKLKKYYLINDNLVNAFCEEQKTDKETIILKLDVFNLHLKSTGLHSYKFIKYATHFKNWFKINIKIEKNDNRKESIAELANKIREGNIR